MPESAMVPVDAVHPELRARIMAATAHAQVRAVRRHEDPEGLLGEAYDVHAVAGDRLVCMSVGLRRDGSVAEMTRTFLCGEITGITIAGDGAVVEVGPGRDLIRVPAEVGVALRSLGVVETPMALADDDDEAEPGFEAAVKGVGQGIAGKLKEIAGELLEDRKLEEEGITQQLDGKLRRAGVESPPRGEREGSSSDG